MPSHPNPDPLENRLREFTPRLEPDDLRESVLDALPSPGETAVTHSGRPLKMLFAVAACAALAVGGYQLLPSANDPVVIADGAGPDYTASKSFRVLQTRPEEQTVVAQEYDSFDISRKSKGAALGVYTIAGVSPDSLELKDATGNTASYPVADLNKAAQHDLDREVRSMQVAHERFDLRAADLQRLAALCELGHSPALTLLQAIADSDSPLAVDARALAAESRERDQIKRFAERIHGGDPRTQATALKALGESPSPLALLALQQAGLELEDDALALHCVRQLAARGQSALSALSVLSEQAPSAAVRAQAQASIETLIEAMRHE